MVKFPIEYLIIIYFYLVIFNLIKIKWGIILILYLISFHILKKIFFYQDNWNVIINFFIKEGLFDLINYIFYISL